VEKKKRQKPLARRIFTPPSQTKKKYLAVFASDSKDYGQKGGGEQAALELLIAGRVRTRQHRKNGSGSKRRRRGGRGAKNMSNCLKTFGGAFLYALVYGGEMKGGMRKTTLQVVKRQHSNLVPDAKDRRGGGGRRKKRSPGESRGLITMPCNQLVVDATEKNDEKSPPWTFC